jgi:hypothetical protein
VVPVLVEADLQGEESLLSRVRSSLEALTEQRGPEGRALVRALLERRRLLVIIDHFIVTSRREESFGGKVVLHLRPERLTADRLWPFFTDYLRLVQAEEALDFDLHERAVGRLREITAGIVDEQQAITVLLAKLYIDVVLAERHGAGGSLPPASVPALMLTYVRQINGAIPEADRQPRELVVRALQHLAQASEEKLFRPRAVHRDLALRALALASAERERGGGPGPGFPAGALRLRCARGGSGGAEAGDRTAGGGQAGGAGGNRPARIALERERRRLRRLIDDLAEPDLAVRLQAIEELCRRRSREAMLMTALGRVVAGLREASQAPMREELMQLLEKQMRADSLDLLVTDEEGWAEHDQRLPVLQRASRALQLAASADLPLLGSDLERRVPMLTLTALRIRTEVVTPAVWRMPLTGDEQLELVVVEGGEAGIGSPETEEGRDWCASQRDG